MGAFSGLNKNTQAVRGVTSAKAEPKDPSFYEKLQPPVEIIQEQSNPVRAPRKVGTFAMGGTPKRITN